MRRVPLAPVAAYVEMAEIVGKDEYEVRLGRCCAGEKKEKGGREKERQGD